MRQYITVDNGSIILIEGGNMAKEDNAEKKQDNPGGLFIPAGVLTGIGVGFIFENVPAGTMIGLGLGFLGFAIVSLIKSR